MKKSAYVYLTDMTVALFSGCFAVLNTENMVEARHAQASDTETEKLCVHVCIVSMNLKRNRKRSLKQAE